MTDQPYIQIAQSEDGPWRWRLYDDEMWHGGYATEHAARAAASAALEAEKASNE